MRVTVLGTRGNIKPTAPRHSRHSGVLVDGTVMLDLGEPGFLRYSPKYVLLTHLHPDHAVQARTTAGTTVYAPEGSGLTISSLGTLELGPYHVTPIPTVHSLHVKSQGYLIESEGERLLYTGDLVGPDPRSQPLPGRLDLVITDGSFIRRGGLVRRDPVTGRPFGHAGIPDLVEFFRRFTPNILFVHFGSWFYHDIAMSRRALRDLGRSRQVRIIVGYDGMQLDLATLAERG